MKKQFDSRHGVRERIFVEWEEVMVELCNGKRIIGVITKLKGKAVTGVQIGNEKLVRHYNQIWKRHGDSVVSTDYLPDAMIEFPLGVAKGEMNLSWKKIRTLSPEGSAMSTV